MGLPFPITSWTAISAARRHSASSADALSKLCATYWLPVYSFIRRKGYSREEAEDLTQEFFARVLQHGTFADARRERGRFRSFLLASVTHFLSNERDRAAAQKRGGTCPTLSLDFEASEERYHREPFHELTPEALFERQWALAALDRVLVRLREEYALKEQSAQFDRLRVFLTGDEDRGSYDQLAMTLNLSAAAVRVAVHRLRRRYAEMIREEIAATVAGPDEVDDEIRFLLAALNHG